MHSHIVFVEYIKSEEQVTEDVYSYCFDHIVSILSRYLIVFLLTKIGREKKLFICF